MGILTLEDFFTLPKHEGEQVEDVAHDDPDYITYLIEKEIVEFDEAATALFEKLKIV